MTTPAGIVPMKPSPDWDMVTLAWAATYLDGTPAAGTLELQYNGQGPMLDDDPELPLSVFGTPVSLPISETTVMIDGVSRKVGYVSARVPVSNDPDIQGGGSTYTFSESLTRGVGRRDVVFVADKDVPGGVIWLNKLPGMTLPPGEPLPVWSYADFSELRADVDALAAGGGGSGDPSGYVQDDDPRLSDARTPTSHQHPTTDVTGLATVATSGAYGDLIGTPTIPQAYDDTALSGRVADIEGAGYITAADVPAAPTWGTLAGKPAVIAAGASATAARNAIGAGTSSLQLGTGSTTAAAGDHTHTQYATTSHTHTDYVTGDGITHILALTQAEYDALTPDAATLYVITD